MKKSKSTPFIIGAIVVLMSLGIVFAQRSSKDSDAPLYNNGNETTTNTTNTTTNNTVTSGNTSTTSTYTLADVAKHNNRSNCWTTINGGVYNVTPWIDQHPGGAEAIISLCGIDGGAFFNAQHGGQARPASELASFKIGILK